MFKNKIFTGDRLFFLLNGIALGGFSCYLWRNGDPYFKRKTLKEIEREEYRNHCISSFDTMNCTRAIKNFKLSEEFKKKKSLPEYNSLNIDSLFTRLKERKAICLKGNYGFLY